LSVPDRLRLPLAFDAGALAQEVSDLSPNSWILHFNTDIFEGRWAGVALRSAGGRPAQLYPDPTATDFSDTEVLARCPDLARALQRFRCPLNAVRLLTLDPGGTIKEHRDYRLGYDDGEVRLHIPILTNPLVEFVLDGRTVDLRAGECWYLNLNLPHRVANRSRAPRVHLVLDCVVNEWLATVITTAATATTATTATARAAP
jgi:quercetin dioxygenase-like cupin family protein